MDSLTKKLLNDFSKTQPALRGPGKTYDEMVKIGDLVEDAIDNKKSFLSAQILPRAQGDYLLDLEIPADAIVTDLIVNGKTLTSGTAAAEIELTCGTDTLNAADVIASYSGVKVLALTALEAVGGKVKATVSVEDITDGTLRVIVGFIRP